MKNNNNKAKKQNLVSKVMEENKCTKYEAMFWIKAITKGMISLLKSNHRVYFRRFFVIKCVKSNSRILRHHITKEKIVLLPRMKPKAFFFKKIKDTIKESLPL